MAFVTAKRWAARKGDTKGIDRVDSAPTAIVDAWGIEFKKRWLDGDRNDVKATDNGKRFVLDASTVLLWEHKAAEGSDFEFGGLKETLLLEKAPVVPRWRTRVDCPMGVVVAYQPELTPGEIAEGNIRPDHVVGSYAVFDAVGCKVGHLYRPFAVDADGKKVWLDMRITPDPQSGQPIQQATITVTGDAAWFAAAKYPVTIDPTFGYTSVGATGVTLFANYLSSGGPHTAPASGDATAVYHYGFPYSAGNGHVGIHTKSGSSPATAVADGGEFAVAQYVPAWYGGNLDSAYAITSGVDYFPSVQLNVVSFWYYDTGSPSGWYESKTYSSGVLPSYSSPTQAASRQMSAYVEYTAAASGVEVTPDAAIAAASAVAPTVVLGAIAVTPAEAAAGAAAVDPTVALGSTSVTPEPATASCAAVAPDTVLGSLAVSVAPAIASTAAIAPTAIAGAVSVAPAAAIAAAASVAPTTDLGSIALSPDAAVAAASAVAPTVDLGSIALSPDAAVAAASAVAPTTIAGDVSVAPDPATANGSAVDPTALLGPLTVAPDAAGCDGAALAPTVALGSIALAGLVAAAQTACVAPTVTIRNRPVAGPYAAVAAQIYTPGAVAGEVYTAGARAGQVYTPGAVAGELASSNETS